MQNVTLRLPKGEVAAIDYMASFLDLNRQSFLFELIGAAMEQAIFTAAGKLAPADRETFVQKVHGLWAAHDVELEGGNDE